ncbi:LysM peptidoglycan-binding domain-containing protein [Chryseobacterium zhengzhouense]|uniref:LysM peptidoglycan-binding domain-containing protein n=1 Tax=Chryseobacterium zhengzhouense TaxID=1636086 RepID=A0ABW2M5T2_9FLAO
MTFIKYEIQKGDTLQSIAKTNNTTINELLDFHNSKAILTQQFFGDVIPIHISHLYIKPVLKIDESTSTKDIDVLHFDKNFMYRTEMTVGTVLEEVMVDNSTCKSQYRVSLANNNSVASVLLEENYVTSSPQLMQAGMELIAEIDKIKCNSIFNLDILTGKISKIVNYKEILKNWNNYKIGLENRRTVLKLSKNQDDIDQFIKIVEGILKPEKKLIEDYYNKMFYELFFTEHLHGNKDFLKTYSKTYYSTFFDKEPVILHFTPSILEETDEILKIRRVSAMDYPSLNMQNIVKLYDERIKPMVQFSFSEYNFSYRETFIWNKKENVLQESHVTAIEEVKNNIQLLIDFKLKRLE